MSTFADLVNVWEYKKPIKWQYLHSHCVNDALLYMSNGLVFYETFEDFVELVQNGAIITWVYETNKLNLTSEAIQSDETKFGNKALQISSSDSLLMEVSQYDTALEGSVSFWFKNAGYGKTLIDTYWGLKVYIDNAGHLNVSITDTFQRTTTVKYLDESYANKGDWTHIVVSWRCRNDSSDYIYLYIDGELVASSTSLSLSVTPTRDTTILIGSKKNNLTATKQFTNENRPSSDGATFAGTASEYESASVNNGILTIDTTDLNKSAYYYYEDSNIDVTTNSVWLEVKCRVRNIQKTSSTSDIAFGQLFGIDNNSNSKSIYCSLSNYGVEFVGESGYGVSLDTWQWHTYRIAVYDSGTKATLYVDGRRVITAVSLKGSSILSKDAIFFGDIYTTERDSCVEYDYIAYGYQATSQNDSFTMVATNGGFGGYIDDFAMWARALDSSEVDIIYNNGIGHSIKEFCDLSSFEISRINRRNRPIERKVLYDNSSYTTSSSFRDLNGVAITSIETKEPTLTYIYVPVKSTSTSDTVEATIDVGREEGYGQFVNKTYLYDNNYVNNVLAIILNNEQSSVVLNQTQVKNTSSSIQLADYVHIIKEELL